MNDMLILLLSYSRLGLKSWGLNHVDKYCPFKKSFPLPGPLPPPFQ